jgi:hypothetical protein
MTDPVHIAFEKVECTLPLTKITAQRPIAPEDRLTTKYKLISNSIKAVGIIEALVVYPTSSGEYLLLDGHTRLDVLKHLGAKEVRCTLSTDDEDYTYNKKVNHASSIAQHFMILKALEHGVCEERLAEALSVNIRNLRLRRDLLNGICHEAVQLLRNRKVAIGVFAVVRKMKPLRQVEAAEHMIAGSTYSVAFAKALLAVTKPELLVKPIRKPKIAATSHAAQDMLGIETERLVKDLKRIEESYGKDLLTLTVCAGYLRKLLANTRVERYLSRDHSELLEVIKDGIAEQ